jgi:hypothetical protein
MNVQESVRTVAVAGASSLSIGIGGPSSPTDTAMPTANGPVT